MISYIDLVIPSMIRDGISTDAEHQALVLKLTYDKVLDLCALYGWGEPICKHAYQPTDTVIVYGLTPDKAPIVHDSILLSGALDRKAQNRLRYVMNTDKTIERDNTIIKQRYAIALLEAKNHCPLMTIDKNSPFAKANNIQPWETLLFIGNYIVKYIWDTRKVTGYHCIDKNFDTSVLARAIDNNEPLDFGSIQLPKQLKNALTKMKKSILVK